MERGRRWGEGWWRRGGVSSIQQDRVGMHMVEGGGGVRNRVVRELGALRRMMYAMTRARVGVGSWLLGKGRW